MKRLIRIFFILAFTFFSFYYTDKMIYLSKMKDPLMIEILNYKNSHNVSYENGILTKNTMLVGSSSKDINVSKSYEKMKKFNSFNENLLEYESIPPVIDKKSNLDKLIKGKKTNKKDISLIFSTSNLDKLEQIVYILDKNEVKASFFIDGKLLEDNILNLNSLSNRNYSFGYYGYNNNYDTVSFKYVKNMLKANKINISNYCLYKNDSFLNTCASSKVNTISPIFISNNLYDYMKNEKKSGLIYQVFDNSYNIKELNSTLLYLKDKGYNLVLLEDLLKE